MKSIQFIAFAFTITLANYHAKAAPNHGANALAARGQDDSVTTQVKCHSVDIEKSPVFISSAPEPLSAGAQDGAACTAVKQEQEFKVNFRISGKPTWVSFNDFGSASRFKESTKRLRKYEVCTYTPGDSKKCPWQEIVVGDE